MDKKDYSELFQIAKHKQQPKPVDTEEGYQTKALTK
jgi:hypothetical protein